MECLNTNCRQHRFKLLAAAIVVGAMYVLYDKVPYTVYIYNSTANPDIKLSSLPKKIPLVPRVPQATKTLKLPANRCPTFKSFNLSVCIHDPKKDIYVSGFLSRGQMWESGLISRVRRWLQKDPSLTLIDIGSNIGLYSLAAAGVGGRKAIAVEPMPHNLELLEASIAKSHLENTIRLIPYAVSDGYYNMSLETDVKNQGRSMLMKAEDCKPSAKISCTYTSTIMLDDLLNVPNFVYGHSILKIDIEGHEIPALMNGKKFWEQVRIPAILMEWQWVPLKFKDGSLKEEKIIAFLDFMKGMNFTHHNAGNGGPLKREHWKKWPMDIVWMSPGFQF